MPRTEHDATMSIFLFHAPATTEIYTLSLHDALPIYPSIISTTGIIEAPAKPRAYYLIMQHSISQGLNLDTLKDKFRGKFLEYHDKNLAQVVRGYRSEERTSELRHPSISCAVFCLKKKKNNYKHRDHHIN